MPSDGIDISIGWAHYVSRAYLSWVSGKSYDRRAYNGVSSKHSLPNNKGYIVNFWLIYIYQWLKRAWIEQTWIGKGDSSICELDSAAIPYIH